MSRACVPWWAAQAEAKVHSGETLTSVDLRRLTRAAIEAAQCALWKAGTAIERNDAHVWASTAAMFTEDAVAYARQAFHFARLRLDAKAVRS